MADQLKSPVKNSTIHVIFRKIEESYPVNAALSVHFSVSAGHEVTNRDWVGLYKVGWRSHNDYIYYEWSPYPDNYIKGMEFENKVVFPGHSLPKNDGEFYQFCYVASSSQVLGASTPFQFKSIVFEDLVEDVSENGEIVVVKTKTSFLEENLEKATNANAQLKKEIQCLESEISVLRISKENLTAKLQKGGEREEVLWHSLDKKNENLSEQKQVNVHLQDRISGLQEKIEVLEQEKRSMEKRLDDNDLYISSLQDKIKNLVTEKESLNGTVRVMEEELKTFKTIFHEQEVLRAALSEEEVRNGKLRKEIESGLRELLKVKQAHDEQTRINAGDKNLIGNLSERLQNAEDKLSAAEHCKMMLNEEVLSLKQAHELAAQECETLQNEVDSLKISLQDVADQQLTDKEIMLEIKKVMATLETGNEKLKQDVERLEEEKSKREDDGGSLFALRVAHKTLVERYANLSKKFEEAQKLNDVTRLEKKALEMENAELNEEGKSLRERILMCQKVYEEKHAEFNLLSDQLRKLSKDENNEDCLSVGGSLYSDDHSMSVHEKLRKYKKSLWKEAEKNVALRANLAEKEKEISDYKTRLDVSQAKATAACESEVPSLVATADCKVQEDEEISENKSQEEDKKFVDNLKLCPFCSISFDANCSLTVMMNHIESHMKTAECPLCEMQFDDSSPGDALANHVQGHFE